MDAPSTLHPLYCRCGSHVGVGWMGCGGDLPLRRGVLPAAQPGGGRAGVPHPGGGAAVWRGLVLPHGDHVSAPGWPGLGDQPPAADTEVLSRLLPAGGCGGV